MIERFKFMLTGYGTMLVAAPHDGDYVRYKDHYRAMCSESARSYEEGIVKGKSLSSATARDMAYQDGLAKGRAESKAAYLQGYSDAESTIKLQQPPDDKTTKQLLNELYHDRARLERVVEDACYVAEVALDVARGGAIKPKELAFVDGILSQFIDTHSKDPGDCCT